MDTAEEEREVRVFYFLQRNSFKIQYVAEAPPRYQNCFLFSYKAEHLFFHSFKNVFTILFAS